MSATEPLTRKRLKELLDYDPETGVFVWKERKDMSNRWNARYAGEVAGTVSRGYNSSVAYLNVKIDGYPYRAHRLAFLYMRGYWPNITDHSNGNGLDNRWRNLNDGTHADNSRNMARSSTSSTGVMGVSLHPSGGKYLVQVVKDGKYYRGGCFSSKEEAARKARQMYAELGFHKNHGKRSSSS